MALVGVAASIYIGQFLWGLKVAADQRQADLDERAKVSMFERLSGMCINKSDDAACESAKFECARWAASRYSKTCDAVVR
ncbi:hypothetical protein MesoLjLc_50820 [Mesorhizobium sp. L-8-10]|uniref:hypothetical protein n=1 Tax=Mesorhizobium sp. L-8-10 TaxID=2744523 RepID=UPI001925CED1|nr:hypothetical protein [Mesorhizobium sp. L-8-10]BCH33152.1 hypothetical protein MesoLjLc_50820 [Mesorhizobium sp. L-8-10]